MPQQLFRTFNRDNRPLSLELERVAATLKQQAATRAWADPEGSIDTIVDAVMSGWTLVPPRLTGAMTTADSREGEWRPVSRGVRVATQRQYVAIELHGYAPLLEHWPDANDALQPLDAPSSEDPTWSWNGHEFADEVGRHQDQLAHDRWHWNFRADETTMALYTFIDLTSDEEAEVASGERDLSAHFEAELATITPIVEAIEAQVEAFRAALPSTLAAVVTGEQAKALARRAVKSVTFSKAWKQPEPKLTEPDSPATFEQSVQPADTDVGARRAADSEEKPDDNTVTLSPWRLDRATFTDVLRTLRVWVDAIEAHPKAYRSLAEERLSDLAVATLNAALPGAHREVYRRGGKSDIFIRANAINTGATPAKVFIGESKWWSGSKDASKALDQLLGYLEVKDTQALLLFFVPNKKPLAVRAEAMKTLMEHPSYRSASNAIIEGWPVLEFEHDGHDVHICIAFVDLPDLQTPDST